MRCDRKEYICVDEAGLDPHDVFVSVDLTAKASGRTQASGMK